METSTRPAALEGEQMTLDDCVQRPSAEPEDADRSYDDDLVVVGAGSAASPRRSKQPRWAIESPWSSTAPSVGPV